MIYRFAVRSVEPTLTEEQFGGEQGAAGSAAEGVMRQTDELPVERRIRYQENESVKKGCRFLKREPFLYQENHAIVAWFKRG